MTCSRLISRTSWILFVSTIIFFDSKAIHAQCDQDVIPPIVLTCTGDFEVSINQGRCTPSIYWPIPTATDACQNIINGFQNSVAFGNWSTTSNGTGAQLRERTQVLDLPMQIFVFDQFVMDHLVSIGRLERLGFQLLLQGIMPII